MLLHHMTDRSNRASRRERKKGKKKKRKKNCKHHSAEVVVPVAPVFNWQTSLGAARTIIADDDEQQGILSGVDASSKDLL